MPSLAKHKSGLAKKVANPKASRQPKPKSEGKMEVADVAEPTWITDPIMDTDAAPKSRQPASAIVAAHKQFMSDPTAKNTPSRHKKVLSKKERKRKELAAQKAEAFKDQLEAKMGKAKWKH